MYGKEDDPVEVLIDRLRAEKHLEMMRLLAAHPQEGMAWGDAYKMCAARQGVAGGCLTLRITEKSPRRPNLLEQPERGSAYSSHVGTVDLGGSHWFPMTK